MRAIVLRSHPLCNAQAFKSLRPMPGCATARPSWFLVPHFVELMMDNPAHGWGVPPYPVVRRSRGELGIALGRSVRLIGAFQTDEAVA